ncbi:unnamed protein product [Staurois parvus]|uniref:Uncharacterized protein n=1 Tax=Staurois parvus TaxID=386267 RepID=A0ABN9GAW5_9NEOB|nr:unnamed protein product [Staurois parvus]
MCPDQEAPSPDNSMADNKNKKTPPNTHPVSPPQVRKRPPEPQKAASSPQVDALVAKLPVLRPRLPTEDKFLSSSPPVRFPPPVLASNIIPGHLKVSPLPFAAVPPVVPLAVTAGVNGTGLVPQPVTQPVISMILPDMVNLEPHALPKANQNGIKELAGGSPENKAAKRLVASVEEGQSKRKRGRPRKVDNSGKGPSTSTAQPGRMVAENPGAPQIRDNAQDAVGSALQGNDSTAPPTTEDPIPKSQLEAPEVLPPSPAETREAQSAPEVRRPDVVPNQVSVIQDGRQSLVQWTVRTAEQRSNREEASTPSESEWVRIQVD